MSLIKYRVRDVAKDFGMTPKEIGAIVGKFSAPPKNNMQVMEDAELAYVFEYLTQTNQVDSIESIFADVYHEPKPAAEETPAAAPAPKGQAKPAQPKAEGKPQEGKRSKGEGKADPPKNQQPQGEKAGGNAGGSNKNQGGNKPAQPQGQHPGKVPQKKIVDTRKGKSEAKRS